jgi:hypothetical protein
VEDSLSGLKITELGLKKCQLIYLHMANQDDIRLKRLSKCSCSTSNTMIMVSSTTHATSINFWADNCHKTMKDIRQWFLELKIFSGDVWQENRFVKDFWDGNSLKTMKNVVKLALSLYKASKSYFSKGNSSKVASNNRKHPSQLIVRQKDLHQSKFSRNNFCKGNRCKTISSISKHVTWLMLLKMNL